jgi:myo-inositol-hexaphosphate 3-phosphohydrolase
VKFDTSITELNQNGHSPPIPPRRCNLKAGVTDGTTQVEGVAVGRGQRGTDGIDVVSAPLGAAYARGLFVAQDDENTSPAALQNFKYVVWADIATQLGLE